MLKSDRGRGITFKREEVMEAVLRDRNLVKKF